MNLRIERMYPREGLEEVPSIGGRGFTLAAPGAGNRAENATFVRTIEQAAALVRQGYSLRMGVRGTKRGFLVSSASLRIVEHAPDLEPRSAQVSSTLRRRAGGISSLRSRAAILEAMQEHDEIGLDEFLVKYGYRAPESYWILHEGKHYPSKAILGVAWHYEDRSRPALKPSEFSGGKNTVEKTAKVLGFAMSSAPATVQPALLRNPVWSRAELMLALDLYLRGPAKSWGPKDPSIIDLSAVLQVMATAAGNPTYRNPNGVAMKLMNFRSLNPEIVSKGLQSVGQGDRDVWNEYSGKPLVLAVEAEAIRRSLIAEVVGEQIDELAMDYAAAEGREVIRAHRVRERDSRLIAMKKKAAILATGGLACEACSFDFAAVYGPRGVGFIEVHHTNPVHAMKDGDMTRLDDLALLCANCHRMVHTSRPWPSINELKAFLLSSLGGVR